MRLSKLVPFGMGALLGVLRVIPAHAHCPLCTIGAAAAAGGAAYLGVSHLAIGLFVGAFGVSTGWWVSRLIKERIKYQLPLLVLVSFLLTVIPIAPILNYTYPWYVSIAGDYGWFLHTTYVLNLTWFTSIIGGLIVTVSPTISKKLSALREGKTYPFQGIALTFGLLILSGVILQLAA